MKKNTLCFVIFVIIISIFASCSKNTDTQITESTATAVAVTRQTTIAPPPENLTYLTSIGSGSNSFVFSVVDLESKETNYLIKTDLNAVGPALTALGMININESNGEITDVNGINAGTNKTGAKWVLYVNGENKTASVNETEIKNGTVYTFKLEK